MLIAFSAAVQAQSSVTVYGSVDGGMRNLTHANAAGDSLLTTGSKGTYKANRLGFKGVEDLDGGLNAHFILESGFIGGTGGLDNTTGVIFNRQAYAGLGGKWGSLDFGRQYTVAFLTTIFYDPFGSRYSNIDPVPAASTGARFNNDVQYAGVFGPVTLRAEYALGEVAGSARNGAAQAVGAKYESGPLTLGAAYTKRKPAPAFLDNQNWTAGGAYALGDATVFLGYINEKQATNGLDTTAKNSWGGALYRITPALALTAAYYQTKTSAAGLGGKKNMVMLNGTYNLSQNTHLYAEIDNSKLSGTTATLANNQTTQTGISAGIWHAF